MKMFKFTKTVFFSSVTLDYKVMVACLDKYTQYNRRGDSPKSNHIVCLNMRVLK